MSKDIKKIAVIFVLIVILMLSAVYILAQLDEEEQQDGQTEGEEQPIELPEGLTGENVRGYNPDAIPPSLDLGSGTVTVGGDFTGDMDVTLNGGTLNIEGRAVNIVGTCHVVGGKISKCENIQSGTYDGVPVSGGVTIDEDAGTKNLLPGATYDGLTAGTEPATFSVDDNGNVDVLSGALKVTDPSAISSITACSICFITLNDNGDKFMGGRVDIISDGGDYDFRISEGSSLYRPGDYLVNIGAETVFDDDGLCEAYSTGTCIGIDGNAFKVNFAGGGDYSMYLLPDTTLTSMDVQQTGTQAGKFVVESIDSTWYSNGGITIEIGEDGNMIAKVSSLGKPLSLEIVTVTDMTDQVVLDLFGQSGSSQYVCGPCGEARDSIISSAIRFITGNAPLKAHECSFSFDSNPEQEAKILEQYKAGCYGRCAGYLEDSDALVIVIGDCGVTETLDGCYQKEPPTAVPAVPFFVRGKFAGFLAYDNKGEPHIYDYQGGDYMMPLFQSTDPDIQLAINTISTPFLYKDIEDKYGAALNNAGTVATAAIPYTPSSSTSITTPQGNDIKVESPDNFVEESIEDLYLPTLGGDALKLEYIGIASGIINNYEDVVGFLPSGFSQTNECAVEQDADCWAKTTRTYWFDVYYRDASGNIQCQRTGIQEKRYTQKAGSQTTEMPCLK